MLRAVLAGRPVRFPLIPAAVILLAGLATCNIATSCCGWGRKRAMPSRAKVVELMKSDQQRGRGTFDFVELPRLGDRVLLGSPLGDLEILEVQIVEHFPAMSEPDTVVAKMRAEEGPE